MVCWDSANVRFLFQVLFDINRLAVIFTPFIICDARLRVQLGVNMPAQAIHKINDEDEVELFEVYEVVLYMGIIDVLQEYNMKKKVEHACKSLKFDPLSISAVEPKLYAKRFLSFLQKVFPEQP